MAVDPKELQKALGITLDEEHCEPCENGEPHLPNFQSAEGEMIPEPKKDYWDKVSSKLKQKAGAVQGNEIKGLQEKIEAISTEALDFGKLPVEVKTTNPTVLSEVATLTDEDIKNLNKAIEAGEKLLDKAMMKGDPTNMQILLGEPDLAQAVIKAIPKTGMSKGMASKVAKIEGELAKKIFPAEKKETLDLWPEDLFPAPDKSTADKLHESLKAHAEAKKAKKLKPLSTADVLKLHDELKMAEKTVEKLNTTISSAKEVLKGLMITVEYSTNNSGGHWWLNDKDWLGLEKAGWKVNWGIKVFCHQETNYGGHNPPNTCAKGTCHGHHVDSFDDLCLMDRFMGASATSATLECIHINQAIGSWVSVVNQDPEEEGCECCGQPHYFNVIKKAKTK